jgi:hypothetical protein
MSKRKDITYHIRISQGNKSVQVSTLGMDRVDGELYNYYSSVDELPRWVQERLSVLTMLSSPPPTCEVANIGSRMGPNSYWVY